MAGRSVVFSGFCCQPWILTANNITQYMVIGNKKQDIVTIIENSYNQIQLGAVVAVIIWWLDLQLPMQSVPITTDVGSTPTQGEVYNIM